MKDKLWQLFKKTGDIRYYVFLKEIESSETNENYESEGNSL